MKVTDINQTSNIALRQEIKNQIDLIAQNVSYTVQVRNDQSSFPIFSPRISKEILRNVSTVCKSGQVTAIMGASGSGKTTLLNSIACRLDTSGFTGHLYCNNKIYTSQLFGDFANYVMQSDILFQTLTVSETLMFAAELKIDGNEEMKKKIVNEIVKNMKLEKCLDVPIGGSVLKGVSGGEKKRTSIAFQLISDPTVLILDQPTSGLDSLTAFIIVKHLKYLAQIKRKTIVMTIHQPGVDIFNMFNRLILLVDGNLVYQGAASETTTYFQRLGLRCPQFTNPADFLMQIIHPQSIQNKRNFRKYYESYDKEIRPKIAAQIDKKIDRQINARVVEVGFCLTLSTLISRDLHNIFRNPLIIKARVSQAIFLGLFAGGLFFNVNKQFTEQDTTKSSKFASLLGALFFIPMTLFMGSLSPVSLTFPIQRQVFQKESGSKLYSVFPYFLSRNIVEIPYLIITPFIFSLIIYWMMGLTTSAPQFFTFYLIAFLMGFVGASFGLLLGSIISSPQLVSLLVPIVIMPIMLFSGFYKNRSDLPVWIGWIEYISPLKYGFISLILNQLQNRISPVSQMNFDINKWNAIGVLFALGMATRILSFFFLWFLKGKLQ